MGLFNDVQDVDAVYQWALLPQGMYSVDTRSFSLAHYGGVLYGEFALGKHYGTLAYQAYGGARIQGRGEGLDLVLAPQGFNVGRNTGPVGGVDLRWRTPLEGLTVGAAYSKIDLTAPDARLGAIPFAD